jgi:prophage regulatory protein
MSRSEESDFLVLRLKRVVEVVGLSRSTIYDRINPKSPRYDDTFPQPIRLGGASVGWLYSDIKIWIESRVESSRAVVMKGL